MLASVIILSISNGRKEDQLKILADKKPEDIETGKEKEEETINTSLENITAEKIQNEEE
jgi:hypothetical protein